MEHYQQVNLAPEGCRAPRCAHLVEIVIDKEHHDICVKRKPMHDPCAWHSPCKCGRDCANCEENPA